MFIRSLQTGLCAQLILLCATVSPAQEGPASETIIAEYLKQKQIAKALSAIDQALQTNPDSQQLQIFKAEAAEQSGNINEARRTFAQLAANHSTVEILRKHATLEDLYGNDGALAYSSLLDALLAVQSPAPALIEVCKRGQAVALRDNQPSLALRFATRLQELGDPSGLVLVNAKPDTDSSSAMMVPGGMDALEVLLRGKAKTGPDTFLADYSRLLTSRLTGATNLEVQHTQSMIHNYFVTIAELIRLAQPSAGGVVLHLSVSDKRSKQKTEKILSLLGLRMTQRKGSFRVTNAENASQSRKQDVLGPLAIDETSIQDTLSSRKAYDLVIPIDQVTAFPSQDYWTKASSSRQNLAGGLAEAFAMDHRLPRLYLALTSMDKQVAKLLVQAYTPKTLADLYSSSLQQYSSALALEGDAVAVPGGLSAQAVWQNLVGVSPRNPTGFLFALFERDGGRMLAYFYTLAQLDLRHQQFFTRSLQRANRFYTLFRDSPEFQPGIMHTLAPGAFLRFLREVPLTANGRVAFPGSAEIWMVAKGKQNDSAAIKRLSKKAAKTTAPGDEDEILIHLARTSYSQSSVKSTELSNFIAVARIDVQRSEPLDSEAALLLAQNFATFSHAYPYFCALTSLTAADFQTFFSLVEKLEQSDLVTRNVRLGELNSVLQLLVISQAQATLSKADAATLFRSSLSRFLAAPDAAAWTRALLDFLDSFLYRRGSSVNQNHDLAMRAFLFGREKPIDIELPSGPLALDPAAERARAFNQVLALQKVPSLESLARVRSLAEEILSGKVAISPAAQSISQLVSSLPVVPIPKTLKLDGQRKRLLETFNTDSAMTVSRNLLAKSSKSKPKRKDIEKLTNELLGSLEPWAELAAAGQIYARYLDPSDLLVSEDPLLLRKHAFADFRTVGKRDVFLESYLDVSSSGEGSYFQGGFATFPLAAARARVASNHVAPTNAEDLGAALIASVRATEWEIVPPESSRVVAARIRLAKACIVEAAQSKEAFDAVQQSTEGLLSLARRKTMLEGIRRHQWNVVWGAVTLSDLYFLGEDLIQSASSSLWARPSLTRLKEISSTRAETSHFGQVAPDLSGSPLPQLRRYEPYEEYQRYLQPGWIAQRTAELKLQLAWVIESAAWPPAVAAAVAGRSLDTVLANLTLSDPKDWRAAQRAFSAVDQPSLASLLIPQ